MRRKATALVKFGVGFLKHPSCRLRITVDISYTRLPRLFVSDWMANLRKLPSLNPFAR